MTNVLINFQETASVLGLVIYFDSYSDGKGLLKFYNDTSLSGYYSLGETKKISNSLSMEVFLLNPTAIGLLFFPSVIPELSSEYSEAYISLEKQYQALLLRVPINVPIPETFIPTGTDAYSALLLKYNNLVTFVSNLSVVPPVVVPPVVVPPVVTPATQTNEIYIVTAIIILIILWGI